MAKGSKLAAAPQRVQVPARIETALLDQVRAAAIRNRRTLGQELSVLIEEALAARAVKSELASPKKR